jgi:hypothetical protein
MNTFKRKALTTAVLAGLGVACGTAEAVYLNPNKTGQALVYPYYTVQSTRGNGWNTYISVVNTTSRAKAVKVRFLEGKTSAEVLDFNLYLSPNDMWTSVIAPTSAAAGAQAQVLTTDVSCTSPAIPVISPSGVTPVLRAQPFTNALYATGGDAIVGTGLDRTREGYVEIIEMGSLTGTWAGFVTHNSAGVPANCAAVQALGATPPSIEAPTGGLVGTGTLINVTSGRDVGYKADALEAWRNAADFQQPGLVNPRLDEATPTVSVVMNAGGIDAVTNSSTLITAYRNTFATVAGTASAGAKAVASVFMHSNVINEYILDAATASLTDWVVTQPLKRQFVTQAAALPPYTNNLTTNVGACESIVFTFFNREEQTQNQPVLFSPQGSAGPTTGDLCWESTVLSIRNGTATMPVDDTTSTVLGSVNLLNVTIPTTFQNGWANLTFTGVNATTVGLGAEATTDRVNLTGAGPAAVATSAVTYFGLPVTGFMIRTFDNGTLTCGTGSCQGNYSALFPHSYITNIVP